MKLCFARVYTAEETKKVYGLCGEFSFVLGKGNPRARAKKGAHPIFLATGYSFKRGVAVGNGFVNTIVKV